ncbi:MAG: hypothetical protein NXI25_23280, partial [bacterium]|nr:hypothetical protein [bacterium]
MKLPLPTSLVSLLLFAAALVFYFFPGKPATVIVPAAVLIFPMLRIKLVSRLRFGAISRLPFIRVVRACRAVSSALFVSVFAGFFAISDAGAQSCNCTEYIYLNEPAISSVLKFEVGPGVLLTEVIGANGGTPPAQHWYPGLGVSELPSPHGLATDLNGRIYIGAADGGTAIRRFDCDGTIDPVAPIFNPGAHQNMFSIGNTIYVNTNGGPSAYNSCTGDLIGQLCLNDAVGSLWGLSYNPVTELVYASQRGGDQKVWVFTRAQLEAGIAGSGDCIDPLVTLGPNATVNVGENFLPNTPGGVFGVVGDNSGNFYVVKSSLDGGASTSIWKYNASGGFVSKTSDGICGTSPFCLGIGVTWSEGTNRLYMSNITDDPGVDCISAFDAASMTYIGAAAPNPGLPTNNAAKAISIIKECCPVNLPATFTKNVCGAVGAKFFLNQEAFDACDGIVCGSSWTPQGALTGMTFDACDNSVTITGDNACGTFTLDIGAVSSTGCGAQSSTFTICNIEAPDATFTATPNCADAGIITLTAATAATHYGISSPGATFYDGPMTVLAATAIPGVLPANILTNVPNAGATYIVRIFNGDDGCFVDEVVSVPGLLCQSSIGDQLFVDENGDGLFNAGDSPIGMVTVTLTPPADVDLGAGLGQPISTETDVNGMYLFEDLPAGDYTVTVDENDVDFPAAVANTIDPDGGNDGASMLTLGESEDNLDQDFGYEPLGTIGDFVWYDTNGDGVQDAGEPGLEGATVTLTPPAGVDLGNGPGMAVTTTTAADGTYSFDNLPAGDYTVSVDVSTVTGGLPAGVLAGLVATFDSDGGMDNTSTFTLGIGENNVDQDFGFVTDGYEVICNCDGSITLDWEPFSTGDTWTVEVEDENGNPVVDFVNMSSTQVTFVPGTLTNGESYYFAITENLGNAEVEAIIGVIHANCNPIPELELAGVGPTCPGSTDGSITVTLT